MLKPYSPQASFYGSYLYDRIVPRDHLLLSGDRLVAMRKGTDLRYVHQDHLTGTAVVSDSIGDSVGTFNARLIPIPGESHNRSV